MVKCGKTPKIKMNVLKDGSFIDFLPLSSDPTQAFNKLAIGISYKEIVGRINKPSKKKVGPTEWVQNKQVRCIINSRCDKTNEKNVDVV